MSYGYGIRNLIKILKKFPDKYKFFLVDTIFQLLIGRLF